MCASRRTIGGSSYGWDSYVHAPPAVVLVVLVGRGSPEKRPASHVAAATREPHASNSPGMPTLSPPSPPGPPGRVSNASNPTLPYPTLPCHATSTPASWLRSDTKCDTNETTGQLRPLPHGAPPSSQLTNSQQHPANIRPRRACRSFKLVGACLVLTFPGHPPCGKRILIGSVVPLVDLRTREHHGAAANTLWTKTLHSMPMQLVPASSGAIPTMGPILSCLVMGRLPDDRVPSTRPWHHNCRFGTGEAPSCLSRSVTTRLHYRGSARVHVMVLAMFST